MKNEKLSLTERIILSNQYRILELLNPVRFNSTDAAHYAELRQIVETADEARYGELSIGFKEEIPAAASVIIDKKNVSSKGAKESKLV